MTEQKTCETCDLKATIFVSVVGNGKVSKANYCKACADGIGLLSEVGYELTGGAGGVSLDFDFDNPNMLKCQSCDFSHYDFERYGRLGCPNCYEVFRNILKMPLSKMHAATCHLGKVPRDALTESILNNRLDFFQKRLDQAVKWEMYEDAAGLRDKIHALKADLQQWNNKLS